MSAEETEKRIQWSKIDEYINLLRSMSISAEELEYVKERFSWIDEIKDFLLEAEIEGTDTVYLVFKPGCYTRSNLLRIIKLIADLHPDEVDIAGSGKLRLWWD